MTATPLNFISDIRKLTLAEFSLLSHAEAARQVKFFDVLFKKVICKQLLPKAIGPISSLFTFAWEPDQYRTARAEIRIKLKPSMFDPRHGQGDVANPVDELIEPLYTVNCMPFAKQLNSSMHVQLFCRYGLLAEIFSKKYEEVEFSFVPKADTTLALPSWVSFRLTTTFEHHTNVPDILAAMLADGLDLTSLRPFLEA